MNGSDVLTTTDVPPNQTLFCYNLNTKINRDDLKRCLFELFCPYGKILDVVASKADPKKRGNAFIVFSSVVSATTALRSLQGRPFLSRPLGISYAKKKSDKVAVLDGTYRMRRPELRKTPAARLEKKGVAESAAQAREDVAGSPRFMYPKATSGATLFVENLPEIMNETALTILFKQYPGFQEARLIPGRSVAFVDFRNELQAEVAMRGLNNFLVTPEAALSISIAKK